MPPSKAAGKTPAKAKPAADGGDSPSAKTKPKAKATSPPKDEASGAPPTALAEPSAAAAAPQPTGAASAPPAEGVEGMLQELDWDSIPGREQHERDVLAIFKTHTPTLCAVFVYYCKASSECATAEMATKLHIAGLRKLITHCALEGPLLPVDNIIRLFGKVATPGETPASAKEVPASTTLDLKGFLSLVLHLAFYRQNPRQGVLATGAPKEGDEKKKPEQVAPILPALKSFVAEVLPKAHKPSTTFASMLQADRTAQQMLQQYHGQLEEWRTKLAAKAESDHGGDMYSAFVANLEAAAVVGPSMIPCDPKDPEGSLKEFTLSQLAARHALIDAHSASDVALGKMTYGLPSLTRAIAACADKKLDGVSDSLPLAWRVRAVVQTLVGELELAAAVSEAIASSPNIQTSSASAEEIDAAQQAAIKKSWRQCWKLMVFKDLVGYPLWETQLHDVLQAAFPELHSIFTFYCGSSIAGSASIASATRIGIMEFLQFAKETAICNKEFKVEDLTRQFYVANTQAMMKNSSSADRKKLPKKGGAKKPGGAKGGAKKKAGAKSPPGKKKAGAKAGGDDEQAEFDQQLNLYEFVNCVVRIAFWRYNPQWGSKYNKKELTPVPESVTLLLEESVLPKARRDTSSEFKKVLAADGATQAVLAEYREKLQNWVRPILHRQRRPDNPNPQMTYAMWVALMDGPDPETKSVTGPKPPCPKMVGEWFLCQESQITGDERTAKKNVLEFKCDLSIAKCRWNFLRSQTIDQMGADEAGEGENSDYATLDFNEMLECIARCAADKYKLCMEQWLPSHDRYMFTMADAVRAWIQNLLFEKSEQMCMWEATVIKADRFDASKFAKQISGQTDVEYRLFCECWKRMPLMDIHHFPLWEKGVHDCLQRHFAPLQRVFAHYTKGISGIDSAADALEMELEEFHDFVKDAKLETKMVNFTTMTIMFAKANATNTAEAFEQRQKERQNSQVRAETEQKDRMTKDTLKGRSVKPGAFPEVLPDRFAADYPEWGSSKAGKKPDNRLVLFEFLACLVRIAFQRANPKFGQYDNKRELVPLPGCLERMLTETLLPNAKQDMSTLFREELANDASVQKVIEEYRPKLKQYYTEACRATSEKGVADGHFTMEAWTDIVKGYLYFKRPKGGGQWVAVKWKPTPGEPTIPEWSLIGDTQVYRESEITGDERCKESYTCRLTMIQCKYAFLNSQKLEQMTAGDATNDDAMATLDEDEFIECVCRCGRDKYDEVQPMSLADGIRGFIQNMLMIKGDEAVIRDKTYIKADRYDWHLGKPLKGQSLAMHRKWLDVWQLIEVADLHYFPLWEKDVHDVLQARFSDLMSIFSHYSKSIGGSTTAEDAVEMTMSEFKDMVKDSQLETKDLRFDVMCNMFIKANALNTNAVREQRINERKSAESKQEGVSEKASTGAAKTGGGREKRAASKKDQEMDQELVLYEFCALLVRISFWRSNPYFGLHKLATKLVPFPDCLIVMLDEVVLPNAKRDDSMLFREKLENDKKLQDALASYEAKLSKWWDATTQSMFLREGKRVIQYQQWQDLLKNRDDPGQNLVGQWSVHQESEITGDERCRTLFRCSLSLPQAKMAFMNSQSLDQMSAGVATDSDAMTTLDYAEFKECVARVAIDKYKSVKAMTEADAIKGFIANLLREANEEEVMVRATLIRADRYDWRRYSKPLQGESIADFKKWLDVWQRVELMDMYYFPLWEKGVHDCLQKHQKELMQCFLGYTRSISEDSAEDALEMSMGEFKDFVDDCGLETKTINFAVMTNMFVKANATNTAQVHQQRMDEKRNAEGKEHEKKIGEKGGAKKASKVAGKNDGTEAVMDQELVFYEFLNMLVRISFQRANPTHGNFGSKAEIIHLPGCLEAMIVDDILPRARRDTAMLFRDTLYSEPAVQAVITEYRDKMQKWYTDTCADDSEETDITDKLGFKQWLRVCKDGSSGNAAKETADRNALVGVWRCHRESEVTGDPRVGVDGKGKRMGQYQWRLSIPQIKAAFMDSQQRDQMGAAQASSVDEMAVLDFDEFLECVARCGVDKYKGVKAMTPADGVSALMANMLGEAEEEEVVVRKTLISAPRYDVVNGCRMATAIDGDMMVMEDVKGAVPLSSDGPGDFEKWMECWSRIEIMDMHLWPLWEKAVHDILQPLFKELQLIFLGYTRSISEDSAEDAMEMDMGEFHDFVVDVGLETKKYTFDVMCNQFVKANATNTAQVRLQRMESRKNASSKDDLEEQKAAKDAVPEKIKGTNSGKEAKKDAELVLYEFIGMLVRIAFWRCNPNFGLFGNNDELVPVPAALSKVLNEVILPNAKRETSGMFRQKQMQDPAVLAVLNDEYADKLKGWYKEVTSNDTQANVISDKITFEDWLRVINSLDIAGNWEVEQLSEITGDASCKGIIKCTLSIPKCKNAFFDSQKIQEMGVAQSDATEATNVLDYEEFVEMIARVGCAKYSAVKVMDDAKKVRAFIQNIIGERDELTVLREDTYIRAVRYDWKSESKPLAGMAGEVHQAFLDDFGKIQLNGIYGFPTWEQEVHDLLLANYTVLKEIFGAYCKTIGVVDAAANAEMDMDEFKDFVLDCKMETITKYKDTSYTFEQMGAAFAKANESGKGAAGPPADAQLQFYEFLGVLVRTSFCTMNPSFGEMLAGDGSTHDTYPTQVALKKVLDERILPNAARDEPPSVFRKDVMALPDVQAVLQEYKERISGWFNKIPFDAAVSDSKLGLAQWEGLLKSLNVVGSFTVDQGSDIVGDPAVGEEHRIRLSIPQAKAAFAASQKEAEAKAGVEAAGVDAITCDAEEICECIARCGVQKYKLVSQISKAEAVRGMCENILGEADEDAVITRATYHYCARYEAASESQPSQGMSADEHAEYLGLWAQLKLSELHGFPTWEKEVHEALKGAYGQLKSIFRAYAAGSLDGSANEMDMEEFHDFVIETDLPTKDYAYDTMVLHYQSANQGSGDRVLELHEFMTMIVRVSFFRANPRSGMINVKRAEGDDSAERLGIEEEKVEPLPGCLTKLLTENILPLARRDNAAEFKSTTLVAPDVVAALDEDRQRLLDWWEIASGGKDTLSLEMWIAELEKRLLFNDLNIQAGGAEHRCRFSIPQAKASFCAACSLPASGMMPEEILEVVARSGVDKYKQVKPMGPGAATTGFIRNLLGEADEEQVVQIAMGGAPPPPKPKPSPPKPKPAPPKPAEPPKPAAPAAPPPAEPAADAGAASDAITESAVMKAHLVRAAYQGDQAKAADGAEAAPPEPSSPSSKKGKKGAGNPKSKGVPGIVPPPPDPDSTDEEEDEEEEAELME